MKIDNRIKHIVEMCNYNETILDIGCDHGYISINLVKQNKCKRCFAIDINEKPLSIAKNNIKLFDLEDKIKCILSNGFDEFSNLEDTSAVIAGIGGSTAVDIINKHLSQVKTMNYVLIQPNSYPKDARRFIYENQFRVKQEDIVFSKGIYYEYILIFPKQQEILSKEKRKILSYFDYEIPSCVFDNLNGNYNDYIEFKINKFKKILYNIEKSDLKKSLRYNDFTKKIEKLKEFLRYDS